jgi:hypothetical protein
VKEAVAGVTLEQFAAVIAALAEAFPLRSVLALEEIDGTRWAQADRGWTERLDRDPELRAWYENEVAAATARMGARGTKPKLVRWSAGARAEGDAAGAGSNAAPTFLAPQQMPLKPDGEWVEAALDEEPDDPLMKTGGTMIAFDPARAGAALPFPNAPSPGDRSRPSEGASIRAMPFQSAPRDDEENTRTSFQPLKSALPFQAGAASALPSPPPPPPRSSAPSAGSTQAIRIVPGVGLPFQSSAPTTPPSAPPAAEEPPMPMERHAYMCLELALDPARTDEVLARYGVSAEVRARADAYYRARLAVDTDLAARWHHAYAAYHAWFTTQQRS